MKNSRREQAVLDRLTQWAETQDFLRAMLLFSLRANPDTPVDIFSDYDMEQRVRAYIQKIKKLAKQASDFNGIP